MHGKRAAGFLWTALHPMVAPLCAILVLVLMWVAETCIPASCDILASLAFGPDGKPAFLGRVLPWLKAPAARPCHLGAPRAGDHASKGASSRRGK